MNFPRYTYEKFLRNRKLLNSWLEVTPLEWADLDIRDLADEIADELVKVVRGPS